MKKPIKPLKDLLDSVRDIEGFPIGTDEDILALSDPPYYTASPNPYINDFIEEYGTPYDEETDDYHREPFVGDVSEGKNNSIYNAHSYHTKVPHKAIIRYLEHFTQKGDLVLDSFCGTGMTGYAAKVTGRNAIISDLSPIAAFIASVYGGGLSPDLYTSTARQILEEIEDECAWMYKTKHEGNIDGSIEYVVWSDVFLCPYCHKDYVFYDAASDHSTGKVNKEYCCPSCNAQITKKQSKRAFVSFADSYLNKNIEQIKQVPVLIVYTVNGKRFSKKPDKIDLDLVRKVNDTELPFWVPTDRMPEGKETRRNDKYGYTHIHHFYSKRSLYSLGLAYEKINKIDSQLKPLMLFTFEQAILGLSKIARYVPTHFSQVNQYLSGTLYVGSQIVEPSLRYVINGKISRLTKVFKEIESTSMTSTSISSTQSITDLTNFTPASIDYIFTDPPFGSNLMYSELNVFWEKWSRVTTNNSIPRTCLKPTDTSMS